MIRALLTVALLGGCTVPAMSPASKTCRADDAIGYVGQLYTARIGRIVKEGTHAADVRTVTPGMMVTQEFRADRANIALDEKNQVTRIYCG